MNDVCKEGYNPPPETKCKPAPPPAPPKTNGTESIATRAKNKIEELQESVDSWRSKYVEYHRCAECGSPVAMTYSAHDPRLAGHCGVCDTLVGEYDMGEQVDPLAEILYMRRLIHQAFTYACYQCGHVCTNSSCAACRIAKIHSSLSELHGRKGKKGESVD
jgi:hypothetical protein